MANRAIVSTAKTPAEFEQFDKIMFDFYGKDFHPVKQKEWWNAFPQGSIILKIDDKVVGGLTLYPLEKTTFEAFKNGRIKEEELLIDRTNRNHWHILDYIIVREHRNITNLMLLVTVALDYWYSFQSGHYPIQVVSTPCTPNGEKGARGLKLKPYLDCGADELPMYFMQINSGLGLKYYMVTMKIRVFYIKTKYRLTSLFTAGK